MTAAEFAQLVRNARRRADGVWWDAVCPAHDDHKASLSFADGERALRTKCHRNCPRDRIAAAVGLTVQDFRRTRPPRGAAIAATYDYVSETGNLLYQVVRFAPKDFRQRRPDPARPGDWLWNLTGARRVLYRLDELALLRPSEAVLVEGERDVDACWACGIPATTNPMGAGKWLPEYAQQLSACGVVTAVLIPDNDDVGRAHMEAVGHSLVAAGVACRWLPLPGVPESGDL